MFQTRLDLNIAYNTVGYILTDLKHNCPGIGYRVRHIVLLICSTIRVDREDMQRLLAVVLTPTNILLTNTDFFNNRKVVY